MLKPNKSFIFYLVVKKKKKKKYLLYKVQYLKIQIQRKSRERPI